MKRIYQQPLTENVNVRLFSGVLAGDENMGLNGKSNPAVEVGAKDGTFEEESLPVDKDLWGNPVEEEE